MTQPPGERDPNAADGVPPAGQPPAEVPTQAWAPPPSPADAAPPAADAAPLPPPAAASPNVLASQAPAPPPGPAVTWSPPAVAAVPEVAPGLTWASTGSRFVAYIIDLFLIGILAGIVAAILGVGQSVSSPGQPVGAQASPYFYAINAAIGGVYFILSWSGGRRATLGQRLLNIQVGNAFDGQALTTNQAVKRWIGLGSFLGLLSVIPSPAVLGAVNLLEFIWSIVLLVTTATSPTKQGLHDRFANSALVRPIGASNGVATACLVIVIGLLVLAVLSIVALIFIGGQVSTILSTVGDSV
jgi:uncharacterized RDD family membrane protein YckC